MECKYPSCASILIKKNSHIHNGKWQVIAIQVGPCNKQTAEKLFYKLPKPLKKPDTIWIKLADNMLCQLL